MNRVIFTSLLAWSVLGEFLKALPAKIRRFHQESTYILPGDSPGRALWMSLVHSMQNAESPWAEDYRFNT